MGPELTVAIVNHETRDLLCAALQALGPASGDLTAQVIVVDNASGDGSADAVARRFPHVDLIVSPVNLGFARACNLASARARAPFFAVLNADTACDPGSLRAIVDWMRPRPEVGAVGPRLRNPDGTHLKSAYRFPTAAFECAANLGLRSNLPFKRLRRSSAVRRLLRTDRRAAGDPSCPRTVDFVTGACMVLRRSALVSVGGFDEAFFLYYEEIDLCRRLAAAGWTTAYLPEAGVLHHLNRSGAQRPALAFRARRHSMLRYHAKYAGAAGWLLLRTALTGAMAGGYLRCRLRPATAADEVGPRDHLEVLRWCLSPASIPDAAQLPETPARPLPSSRRDGVSESESPGGVAR